MEKDNKGRSEIMDKIIRKMIVKRKEKGLTHENMGIELGISAAAYYKIESGATNLSLERFIDISKILEIKMEEVFDIQTQNVYNQEFRDHSISQQIIENMYTDNKEMTERYISTLEGEIKRLKELLGHEQTK
ncbi:MAG: transcriptional regulator [Flavobacteriales bacterium]|mgnify:CR=1 FL=1|nr:transcriptional regulator [Flavobacteriales bacterium]|tara:strand:- start:24239 stop:24634 length:396 start_codon:yes stop_codon:yes gene_type:complete